MGAFLGHVVRYMSDSVDIRKRCVQYEMEDHSSTAAAIGRQYSVSKSQCMMSCVRNRSCNTFNFRSIDGLCDLLETSDMCMSHTVTNGTTLVRLSGCEATPIPPWMVMVPTQRKLQWMEPSAVGSQRVILRTPAGTRKVARVLHEGVYLSGQHRIFKGKRMAVIWYARKQYSFWHMHSHPTNCGSTLRVGMKFQRLPSLVDIHETKHLFMLSVQCWRHGNPVITT